MYARHPVQCQRQRELEFAIAPAASLMAQGDGGFTARQQDNRCRIGETGVGNLTRQRRMYLGDIARFALDPVGQHPCVNAFGAGSFRGRFQ